ncbi:DNA polymerase I [bacterium (Candidatus Howlettbacteria) CG_4_10_14_0_8_um_filter_40_9]|nr:MAG: DNA polymerase I [bacterium (Candidatus Howlettbacteria) CG_4_10_14_0_8_um_filter_40_9]
MKFVLFDGNAVVHRAYHAIPPLTTKSGETVHAVYGFSMILLNVIKELKPDCVAVAFDVKGPTFRHEKFKEYKATRAAHPEDLFSQFALVKKVLDAFLIPYFEKSGFEADDVIGTISTRLKNEPKQETFIVTGDLDELQLVNKNTKVYTMRRGFTDTVIYDEKAVEVRYGFSVDKFVDYKALRGDPSDNIPGVKGIGEKTAIDLIKQYGSLENIYKHLDELKVGVKRNLEIYKDDAFLSKDLSTIVTDVPIKFDETNCSFGDYDKKKVFELFRELEFKSLLSRLPEGKAQSLDSARDKKRLNGDYTTISTEKDFKTFKMELEKQKEFAFDTETTSLNTVDAGLVGLCFSWKEGEGFYIPVGHRNSINNKQLTINNDDFADGQLDIDRVLENLKPIIEDSNIRKIGHNLKYDYSVLRKYDIRVSPLSFDTMIASYLLNPNSRALKLDDAAFTELGIEMIPITKLIGKKKAEQINFAHTEIVEAATYAAEDADITYRLYNHLKKEIEKQGFSELMETIEMPLVPILAEMELAGVKVDEKFLIKSSAVLGKRIAELEKDIWKKAGEEFNIASPIQLKVILFEKLKLAEDPEIKRNLKKVKSGGYSTAATELEKIRSLHPIIDLVSEYRELAKLKSTYVDALPELINKKTGRVHTSFNQTITATGRLSSSDPNLQNIPIRTEVGREIRKAFIAEKGFKLIAADYSQIELRVIAHIADDKAMIEAFHGKTDIHTRTAAQVFGVPESKVDSDMRRAAKVINFGVIYGISPHGLALATGMSREESKSFIDKYFAVHPHIKKYTEEIVEVARETGFVETIFGRKRYLPDLHSSNFIVRGSAERMAINMPIQGTAADLMKLAMKGIGDQMSEVSSRTRMILQVHDELVFETPEADVKKVAEMVKEKMENVISLKVPIEVKVEFGDNWGKMVEI